MKEQDLARYLVNWLKSQYWEVYQEVEPRKKNSVADIVAVKDKVVWVIETKTSMSLTLLGQALNWKGHGNFISVCIPQRKPSKALEASMKFLSQNGIGLLEYTNFPNNFVVSVKPRFDRKRTDIIYESLHEKQKDFAEAGNSDGLRWTPFKETCFKLRKEVNLNPGLTLKEYIDKIHHHYNSDKTAIISIRTHIRSGLIEGVIPKIEKNKLRLYPPNKE